MTAGREPVTVDAGRAGLLGKLMAAVRPEFRVDIYVPERGALVFGAAPCRVPGCVRQPRTRGLCKGHYYKWKDAGRPDIDQFAATASPEGLGRKDLTACIVPGCRYGGTRQGLCVRHQGFWERAGKPDRAAWLAGLTPVHDPGHPVCALSYCTLWAHGRSPFCVNHRSRWEAVGRPPIDEFMTLCESYGDDRFDFRPLGDRRQLKLELQYALQCRHDERQVKTPAAVARPVITLAAAGPVASLLDWPIQRWGEFFDASHAARHGQNGQLAFLRYAYQCLEDLLCGIGWEAEFPRDVWELRRLGIEGRKRLRFDGIPQPWLRQLAKRFARWRLSIGRSPIQAYVDVQAVTRLAGFLASPPVGVTSLADVARFTTQEQAGWLSPLRLGAWLKSVSCRGRTDPAVLHAQAGPHARARAGTTLALVAVLRVLNAQIQALAASIGAQLDARPDAAVFQSLPRSGTIRAARLLAEIGDARGRFPTRDSLTCLAGVAPSTRQPGKVKAVTFRLGADKQLRDALCDFAGDSRRASPWAADLYDKAIARGCDHPHAVRILARAWAHVIWRCWQDHAPYDPAAHNSLQTILRQRQPIAA
jgi:hypothetical protein